MGIESAIVIHQDRSMMSKYGELVVLVTIVVDVIPAELTIFDEDNYLQKDSEKFLDNHNIGYQPSQKIIGIFKYKQVKFVILLCKTAQ